MQTNPNPEKDTFYINAHEIGCDGGANDGNLGHPLVFLELENNGNVICPYCSRKYVHKEA